MAGEKPAKDGGGVEAAPASPKKSSKAEPVKPAADAPKAIKLLAPHGFIDEATGQRRYWQQGQVVFDPADIALLIQRGAAHVLAEAPVEPKPIVT